MFVQLFHKKILKNVTQICWQYVNKSYITVIQSEIEAQRSWRANKIIFLFYFFSRCIIQTINNDLACIFFWIIMYHNELNIRYWKPEGLYSKLKTLINKSDQEWYEISGYRRWQSRWPNPSYYQKSLSIYVYGEWCSLVNMYSGRHLYPTMVFVTATSKKQSCTMINSLQPVKFLSQCSRAVMDHGGGFNSTIYWRRR